MGELVWRLRTNAAARAAGVSRWTLWRDVKDGKLSCTTDGRGRRRFDAAELERVYGRLNPPETADGSGAGSGAKHRATDDAAAAVSVSLLTAAVKRLEYELERTRADAEAERQRSRADLEHERQRAAEIQTLLAEQVRSWRQAFERLQLAAPAPARPNGAADGAARVAETTQNA